MVGYFNLKNAKKNKKCKKQNGVRGESNPRLLGYMYTWSLYVHSRLLRPVCFNPAGADSLPWELKIGNLKSNPRARWCVLSTNAKKSKTCKKQNAECARNRTHTTIVKSKKQPLDALTTRCRHCWLSICFAFRFGLNSHWNRNYILIHCARMELKNEIKLKFPSLS